MKAFENLRLFGFGLTNNDTFIIKVFGSILVKVLSKIL